MRSDSGITVLETLIVLSVLAMVALLALPRLHLPIWLNDEHTISQVLAELGTLRHRAVSERAQLAYPAELGDCKRDQNKFQLFADGSVTGGPICVQTSSGTELVFVDLVTWVFYSDEIAQAE